MPPSELLARKHKRPFPKGEEQSHLSRSPDRKEEESHDVREPHFGEIEGESEREHGEERVSSTMKAETKEKEGGQAKRASLGEVGKSISG